MNKNYHQFFTSDGLILLNDIVFIVLLAFDAGGDCFNCIALGRDFFEKVAWEWQGHFLLFSISISSVCCYSVFWYRRISSSCFLS